MLTTKIVPDISYVNTAIYNHNYIEAQKLIEQMPNVNVLMSNGISLMHSAVASNDPAIVDMLINRGANINIKDQYGNTPLHLAVNNNYLPMVQALLQRGANPNEKNNSSDTPLGMSIGYDFNEISKFLIAAGASLDIADANGVTPLWKSLRQGQEGVVPTAIISRRGLSPRQIYLRRRLSIVFGNLELNKILSQYDGVDYNKSTAGRPPEAARILASNLIQFLNKYSLNTNNFNLQKLCNDLKHLQEQENSISSDIMRTGIMRTGCCAHAMYVYFFCNANEFKFVLAERGPLSPILSPSGLNSILIMDHIPREQWSTVVNTFISTRYMGINAARKMIYIDLPQALHINYEVADITELPFKGGYCYYANLKALIYYLFLESFGPVQGKINYKKFDIEVMENELNQYISTLGYNHAAIINFCQQLLQKKYQQFDQLLNNPGVDTGRFKTIPFPARINQLDTKYVGFFSAQPVKLTQVDDRTYFKPIMVSM